MESKLIFKFQVKDISENGTFSGYASTFSNEDLGGDIVAPGAFKKTISENPEVPILWSHDELIGVNKTAEEDRKGLYVEGELNLEVQRGREAYALAKQRAVKGLSIGFSPITVDYSRAKEGVRILKEVKLYEYSLTPFPMNERAGISNIKSWDDVQVETARMEKFLSKQTLSTKERDSLQRKFAQLMALLATSASNTIAEAGDTAAAHQDEAPEEIHATLSDFTSSLAAFGCDLKNFSLRGN
jgi:HK97 family phage prohead protease